MLVYGEAFWPTYTTGDNTGLIATDSMKNFIQRETLHFVGPRSRRVLPVPRLALPRPVSAGRGRAAVGRRDSVRDPDCGRRPYAVGPGTRHGARRAAAWRDHGGGVGPARVPPAAAPRQRVSRVRARRVHHPARPRRSPAAHVARSGVAAHRPGARVQRRSVHGPGAHPRARGLRDLRVGQHPAGHPSDRDRAHGGSADAVGGAPRGAEPHVGYDCRARRARPVRGCRAHPTAAWA